MKANHKKIKDMSTYNKPAIDIPQYRVWESDSKRHLLEHVQSCPILKYQYHKTYLKEEKHRR